MAEPYRKKRADGTFGDTWYAAIKDRHGKWIYPVIGKLGANGQPLGVKEARRINNEWQVREDRIRAGLEAPPAENAHATFGELIDWWLVSRTKASEQAGAGRTARKHLCHGALAKLPPASITPGKIEAFLFDLEAQLAPATLNNLRKAMSRAFNAARKSEKFFGPNPITSDVKVRVVPTKAVRFYEAEWVLPMLGQVAPQHLKVVAVAFLQGLRKNELFALEKVDVDWARAQLIIRRSRAGAATTKGKAERPIPIHPEAVPYLMAAIDESPCERVFVNAAGEPYKPGTRLSDILRTAMRRAQVGITHYVHKCRRAGCGEVQQSADGEPRRCGRCGMKLWVTPEVAKLRFHDTRHTTASLLAMQGATVQAIQKYLRHSNSRQTEHYMHLAPGYLRDEIGRLTFGLPRGQLGPGSSGPSAEPIEVQARAAAGAAGFPTPFLPGAGPGLLGPITASEKPEGFPTVNLVGATGFEPATPSPPVPGRGVSDDTIPSQGCEITGVASGSLIRPSSRFTAIHSRFPTPFLPDPLQPERASGGRAGLRTVPDDTALLGVKDVARELGICAATVYKLCDRGDLPHVRLGVGRGGNAVRVTRAALEAFIASRARGGAR